MFYSLTIYFYKKETMWGVTLGRDSLMPPHLTQPHLMNNSLARVWQGAEFSHRCSEHEPVINSQDHHLLLM